MNRTKRLTGAALLLWFTVWPATAPADDAAAIFGNWRLANDQSDSMSAAIAKTFEKKDRRRKKRPSIPADKLRPDRPPGELETQSLTIRQRGSSVEIIPDNVTLLTLLPDGSASPVSLSWPRRPSAPT